MTALVVMIGASTVIEAAVAGLHAVVGIVTGGLVQAVVSACRTPSARLTGPAGPRC